MDKDLLESKDPELKKNIQRTLQFAATRTPILIHGPWGSGKKTLAKKIHEARASEQPLKFVDCALLTDEKALSSMTGTYVFMNCEHLGAPLQNYLLKLIEDKNSFMGQLIFSTTKTLAELSRDTMVRNDFLLRISIVQVALPALAERREDFDDICLKMFEGVKKQKSAWLGKTLSDDALQFLRHSPWPGNLSELRLVLEQALYRSSVAPWVSLEHFAQAPQDSTASAISLTNNLRDARDAFEKDFISQVLSRTKGNKTQAAKLLGLSREGLRKALNKKAA